MSGKTRVHPRPGGKGRLGSYQRNPGDARCGRLSPAPSRTTDRSRRCGRGMLLEGLLGTVRAFDRVMDARPLSGTKRMCSSPVCISPTARSCKVIKIVTGFKTPTVCDACHKCMATRQALAHVRSVLKSKSLQPITRSSSATKGVISGELPRTAPRSGAGLSCDRNRRVGQHQRAPNRAVGQSHAFRLTRISNSRTGTQLRLYDHSSHRSGTHQ